MRTVYLGTSAFAAAVLRRLSGSEHRPSLVVSRPDARRGRGRRLSPPETVIVARELGLPVEQFGDINAEAALDTIRAARPQLLVVCAFGALIGESLLHVYPILNVHPSLLPRWRGAAPIERAILAGDTETGVSIMRLTAGLDSGPVGLRQRVCISAEDDYGSLAAKLERVGGDLLVRALDAWAGATTGRDDAPHAAGDGDPGGAELLTYRDQAEDGVTYADKLTAEDRRLDLNGRPEDLVRRVRALSPHIGAYLELADGGRLGVWQAAVSDGRFQPLVVQPPGKRRMSWDEYHRGLRT